jgi:hypothetical protein
MSLMALFKVRNVALSAVEAVLFFLFITPIYFIIGPVVYAVIARAAGVVQLSSPFRLGQAFQVFPAWLYVIQALGYLFLITVYWTPRDDEGNDVELSALKVFLVLLPVIAFAAAYARNPGALWAMDWNAVRILAMAASGIGALTVLGLLLYAGGRLAAGSKASYGRCFVAWVAALVMGAGYGGLVLLLAQAIGGAKMAHLTFILGLGVGVLFQWGTVKEMLQVTWAKAIVAWLVPFAASLIALLVMGAAPVVWKLASHGLPGTG